MNPQGQYKTESFLTDSGKEVVITLIKHGTLAISYEGKSIQVDPVAGYGKPTDYSVFPKADIVLVTHEHGDHFDKEAIGTLTEEGKTEFIANRRCVEMMGYGTALSNGDSWTPKADWTEGAGPEAGLLIKAVPAYNYTEGRTQFHPKGRDNGYLIKIDGFVIYIAGDTEDIPEMADIAGDPEWKINVAFLPVNQPYTMTVEQCVRAAKTLKPNALIPYHFSETDLSALPELLPEVDVMLRNMQ